MANTVQSRKSKGRLHQQYVVKRLLETFPSLTERDVVSQPGGVPGVDVRLSEAAAELIPYAIEAKNQEKLSIWQALAQAEQESRTLTPLLVFKRNRSTVYCALRYDDFLDLLKRATIVENEQK